MSALGDQEAVLTLLRTPTKGLPNYAFLVLCHGSSIVGGIIRCAYEKRNDRSTNPISNGYGSSLAGICVEVESS